MSALRARCPGCGTLTAVALEAGYECHACGREFTAGLVRVPQAWGSGGEAMAAAAAISLDLPEAGTVDAISLESQSRAVARALPARPVVVGGCCCAHVGAVAGLAQRHGRIAVVWLDAHGDLNTPETSPSGNAWGMPLRMVLDDGVVAASDVALIGARNLDPPEVDYLARTGLVTDVARLDDALAGTSGAYVALDLDVLDPSEGVDVWMPEPLGLSLEDVVATVTQVRRAATVLGLGLTGLNGAGQPARPFERVIDAAFG